MLTADSLRDGAGIHRRRDQGRVVGVHTTRRNSRHPLRAVGYDIRTRYGACTTELHETVQKRAWDFVSQIWQRGLTLELEPMSSIL